MKVEGFVLEYGQFRKWTTKKSIANFSVNFALFQGSVNLRRCLLTTQNLLSFPTEWALSVYGLVARGTLPGNWCIHRIFESSHSAPKTNALLLDDTKWMSHIFCLFNEKASDTKFIIWLWLLITKYNIICCVSCFSQRETYCLSFV